MLILTSLTQASPGEAAAEELDETAARMQAGSIKAALFDALRAAGPDGLDIGQLVDAVQVGFSYSSCWGVPGFGSAICRGLLGAVLGHP